MLFDPHRILEEAMKLTRLLIIVGALTIPAVALAADHAISGSCPLHGWCPFC